MTKTDAHIKRGSNAAPLLHQNKTRGRKVKIINYKELTPELARAGCFVLDMPNEDYHSYEGISKSGLDLINRSPLHFMAGKKFEPTPAMRMGTIVHTAVLEPERFDKEYIVLKGINDKRKTEYKEAAKQFGKDNTLTHNEGEQLKSLVESISSQQELQSELDACDLFEVSAFVEIDGVLCRCRYDALNTKDHISIDLKTTKCSEREEFAKSVYNFRYHVQDALYSLVYELITGEQLNFKFLAVENEPPHCPMMYELDNEARLIGNDEALRNLEEYRQASDSHEWKGYEQTNEPLSLPSWALARYDNELEGQIV